jgi:hypothetical protein
VRVGSVTDTSQIALGHQSIESRAGMKTKLLMAMVFSGVSLFAQVSVGTRL